MARPAHVHASRGEELVNSVTHGAGAVLFAGFGALLVARAAADGDPWRIVSGSVYVATLVLFYTTSTLYHAFRGPRVKTVFRVFDHAAIYLLIAGSYTPFVLVTLRGPWGWTLFGIVWALAAFGVVFKSLWTGRLPVLSTGLYVAMGWCMVFAFGPLSRALPRPGLLWLVAGGIVYSVGIVFYALGQRVRFAHAIWHVFVLGGSACHFVAVLRWVIPASARGVSG